MEVGNAQSITSSYGTATLNDLEDGAGLGLPDGNGLLIQDIAGGEYPATRATVENAQQHDGAVVHKFFRGPTVVRISGLVVATTPANRQTLKDHLAGVLEPLLTEDGTWDFGAATHTIRYYDSVVFESPSAGGVGAGAGPKRFSFGLVVRT